MPNSIDVSSAVQVGEAEAVIPGAGAATRLGRRLSDALDRPNVALGVLCAVFAAAVALYYLLVARGHVVPDLAPDEFFYGRLSQNFAAGHGLTWEGVNPGLPPLYPLLLSLAWHGSSVFHGYAIAKLIGTIAACLVAFPVWLLGRGLVGPRIALIPAVLSIAGAWMQMSGKLVSENLAYPLSTAALCATVMALRRPGWRWFLAALGLGVAAMFTRAELVLLPGVLALAVAIDIARQPREGRLDKMFEHPWQGVLALWLMTVIGTVLLVTHPFNFSVYDLGASAPVSTELSRLAQNALSVVAMTIVVPVACALALAARGRNWRDPVAGPLLSVTAPAAAWVLVVTSRFDAAFAGGAIERYVIYVVPMFLLLMVVTPRRVDWRVLVGATAATALSLVAASGIWSFIEQPAAFGTRLRFETIGFAPQSHLILPLFGLALGVPAALALGRRRLGLAALLVLAGMLIQSQANVHREAFLLARLRPLTTPTPLDWVGRSSDARAALVNINGPTSRVTNLNYYTEFFNPNVDATYDTLYSPLSSTCRLSFGSNGYFRAAPGRCLRFPSAFVIERGFFYAHLYGERLLAQNGVGGWLVRIPKGHRPRLLSLLGLPCAPGACPNALQLALFLDRPGSVTLRFGPPGKVTHMQVGQKVVTMRAPADTTVTLAAKPGPNEFRLPTDIGDPKLAPPLLSAVLQQGSVTTRLN